jgi:DNA topoisomerase-1
MDINLVDLSNLTLTGKIGSVMDNFYLYGGKKKISNIDYDKIINKINLSRAMAFDDKNKKKGLGIYRESYYDENDIDKKGNPKLKFKYYYSKTKQLVSKDDLERINKLGLAPAYTDVWVSEDSTSKIQATGIDAKGRKQYRYHPRHIEIANEDKFLRLFKFIKSIPKLDEKMEEDKKSTLYSKNRTISVMLSIVKELNIRVGKECYAQTNKSYGISSLKKSHVTLTNDDTVVKLNFKAKSNKQVSYTLKDPEIVNEIKQLLNLEGEKLFQYISESNNTLRVSDTDLNQYIQNYMGKAFTCKDFRTYAANFYFIKALLTETKKRSPKNKKIIKQNLNSAQESTAFYLRHTKSISKKSYTMGLIRDMYNDNPDWFIENKNRQPLNVLIDLLKIFRDKIKEKRAKESGKEYNPETDDNDDSVGDSDEETDDDETDDEESD